MINELNYIENFRKLLLEKGEVVGDIEMTTGNFDDNNNVIEGEIPTITTDFCEIGNCFGGVYFTFVIYSNSYEKEIFNLFENFDNLMFYPFFDFKKRLYPIDNFKYDDFEKTIKLEKYFQMNFAYRADEIDTKSLYKEYMNIKNTFAKTNAKIVNQLEVDLTKESQ